MTMNSDDSTEPEEIDRDDFFENEDNPSAETPRPDYDAIDRNHAICDRFEADLNAGQTPSIDEALAQAAPGTENDLLAKLIGIEADWRKRSKGKFIRIGEYLDRFPGKEPIVIEALVSVLLHWEDEDAYRAAAAPDVPTEDAIGGCRQSPNLRPRFEIIKLHQKGGLGEIYIARDHQCDRIVAIKQIQKAFAQDPERQERFEREAKTTSQLEHPGIVPVYAASQFLSGERYYAMRYVEGETLTEAIQRFHEAKPSYRSQSGESPYLEFRKLLAHLVAVCKTIAYAHSKNFIHRDLKPQNIMLGPFGETLVLDWGVAKQLAPKQADSHEDEVEVEHAPEISRDKRFSSLDGYYLGSPA